MLATEAGMLSFSVHWVGRCLKQLCADRPSEINLTVVASSLIFRILCVLHFIAEGAVLGDIFTDGEIVGESDGFSLLAEDVVVHCSG